jgi:hypothetical protein
MGKWRHQLFSIVAISSAVLAASPSWAAVVEPGIGDLTINQGQGFKTVTHQSTANVGDSVMVGPGGAATITYDDGCKVTVQPGSVASIAPLSPCASGSYAQTYNDCPIGPDGVRHCEDTGWLGWGVLAAALATIITIPIVGSQHHAGPPFVPTPASP